MKTVTYTNEHGDHWKLQHDGKQFVLTGSDLPNSDTGNGGIRFISERALVPQGVYKGAWTVKDIDGSEVILDAKEAHWLIGAIQNWRG